MGFVFRKSVKLAPGVRLNVSKRGFGISAGVKGARLSLSSKGRVTGTVGLPGSGMRYTESVNLKSGKSKKITNSDFDNSASNLDIHTRAETFAYLNEMKKNKTNFSRYGARFLLILLLVSLVSGIVGASELSGGILAISWFLGVALLASFIRRVFKSKRNARKLAA